MAGPWLLDEWSCRSLRCVLPWPSQDWIVMDLYLLATVLARLVLRFLPCWWRRRLGSREFKRWWTLKVPAGFTSTYYFPTWPAVVILKLVCSVLLRLRFPSISKLVECPMSHRLVHLQMVVKMEMAILVMVDLYLLPPLLCSRGSHSFTDYPDPGASVAVRIPPSWGPGLSWAVEGSWGWWLQDTFCC